MRTANNLHSIHSHTNCNPNNSRSHNIQTHAHMRKDILGVGRVYWALALVWVRDTIARAVGLKKKCSWPMIQGYESRWEAKIVLLPRVPHRQLPLQLSCCDSGLYYWFGVEHPHL